ncbi:MAG: cell division ATP-binding protein FtsE [Mycobacteriales bacterium]
MIRFEKVSKVYPAGRRPALDNVDVEVGKGDFVFLIGPSGSGKTTFLRLMLKEENPTRGSITIAGRELTRLPRWKVPALRRTIGCVFQDFRLLPSRNVAQNVGFALEVIGKKRKIINRVVPEVLDLVGLTGKANRLPRELSGGEQQRVAIARAFVNRPLVLLADEPTGNLDPDTSQDIMLLLERINRTGTTVLMATHDNTIVDSMRRRVVELELGKLVRDQARGVYGVGR